MDGNSVVRRVTQDKIIEKDIQVSIPDDHVWLNFIPVADIKSLVQAGAVDVYSGPFNLVGMVVGQTMIKLSYIIDIVVEAATDLGFPDCCDKNVEVVYDHAGIFLGLWFV